MSLREALVSLAEGNPKLLLAVTVLSPPAEFREALNELLSADPSLETLSEQDKGELFYN